ncbi:hypothetical protein, partial [Ralstonia pseudosolanacearum]
SCNSYNTVSAATPCTSRLCGLFRVDYLTCASTIAQKFDAANETARRMVPSPMWVASVPGMVDTAQKDGALSNLYKTRVQLPRIAVPAAEEGSTPAPVAASAVVAASTPVAAPAFKTRG